MDHAARPVSRRGVVAAFLAMALLTGLGVYGVMRDDRVGGISGATAIAASSDPVTAAISATPSTTEAAPVPISVPSPLPSTVDSAVYAAAVATLLFGMDQRAYSGADYLNLLVAARPPKAADLIPDVTDDAFLAALRERIPDDYMWQRMRDSGQYAEFDATRVWEPKYIAAKRASGDLPDGVVGLNVAGTQTIYYLDENDEPAQRERAQSVSLLVACAPVQTECGLIAVSTGVVE